MKLSDFLSEIGRPIAYYPKLAHIIGNVKAALFLCQLFYWKDKGMMGDGWIFKTSEEWKEETGLSYDEQRGARKTLSGLGLLEEKHDRLNHRMFYRVNVHTLNNIWDAHFPNSENPNSGNGKTQDGESLKPEFVNRNTETTAETTTETKDSAAENKPRQTRVRDMHFESLSDICGMTPLERDWKRMVKTAAGQLNRYAKELREAGATPEQISAFGAWWSANDWRGQKGQLPKPADVVKSWPLYMNGHTNGNGKVTYGSTHHPGDRTPEDQGRISAHFKSIARTASERARRDVPALPAPTDTAEA